MSLDLERRRAERAALLAPDDPRARARAALADCRVGVERVEQWVAERLHGRALSPGQDEQGNPLPPRCSGLEFATTLGILRAMVRYLVDPSFDTPYVWGPRGLLVVQVGPIVGFGVSWRPGYEYTARDPGWVWGLDPWRTWMETRTEVRELRERAHIFMPRSGESFKDTFSRSERMRQLGRVRKWANERPRLDPESGLTDRAGFTVEQARIFAGVAPLV